MKSNPTAAPSFNHYSFIASLEQTHAFTEVPRDFSTVSPKSQQVSMSLWKHLNEIIVQANSHARWTISLLSLWLL